MKDEINCYPTLHPPIPLRTKKGSLPSSSHIYTSVQTPSMVSLFLSHLIHTLEIDSQNIFWIHLSLYRKTQWLQSGGSGVKTAWVQILVSPHTRCMTLGLTSTFLFVPQFLYRQNGNKNNVYPHKALRGTKIRIPYITRFIVSTLYIVPAMIIISFYLDPISPIILQYKSSDSVWSIPCIRNRPKGEEQYVTERKHQDQSLWQSNLQKMSSPPLTT